uniref:F-box domain-containing protein n=1 Tax=Meloidogyne incognita TaxID=6306 RepID=A0A914LRG8_MELIC
MVPHPFSSFLLFLFNKHQGSQSFASLPLEIVFQIFDSSSPKDLANICVLNRLHFNRVSAYLNSERFFVRFRKIFSSSAKESNSDFPPNDFARLIRLCCLLRGKAPNAISCSNFIIQLYQKIDSYDKYHDKNYWGKLITKISFDWSQSHFISFMIMFSESTGLLTRVRNFFKSKKNNEVEELALRRVILSLFLNDCSFSTNDNSSNVIQQISFRLSAILHLFGENGEHKYRLMLLLTAPTSTRLDQENDGFKLQPMEFVNYQRIVADPIFDRQSAQTYLGELPQLVEQLLFTKSLDMKELRWNELELFNFLELLTTYPEPWVLRNFASLLILAPGLAKIAICIRALHGDPAEAGNTLFSCIEASILLGFNTNVTLRDTLFALTTKCSPSTCLTVLREAISTTNNLTIETFGGHLGGAENGPINLDEMDFFNLKNALEANRQIAELFLTHLHQII